MDNEPPTGQLFSRIYLERGKLLNDSDRFRIRFCSYLTSIFQFHSNDLHFIIENNLGIEGPGPAGNAPDWPRYFRSIAFRDVLDIITLVYQYDKPQNQSSGLSPYIVRVRMLLADEQLGYRIDDAAGVHPLVDEDFERSRMALIANMGKPRYGAALAHFEAAQAALDGAVPDTRTAVREMFDALETVFKLMLKVSRLGKLEIQKDLAPRAQVGLVGAEKDAFGRLLASFAEWTNAAHQYRHAQGVEQLAPPSMDLAVLMIGSGSAYLRWLVKIDAVDSMTD